MRARLPSAPLAGLAIASLVACGTPMEPDPPGLGEACAERACADGLSCVRSDRFPEGYCTVTCLDGACPPGSRCELGITPALCLADCAAPSDCRPGYQCWRGACRPTCLSDGDCGGEGATCGMDGTCLGPQCIADQDCGPSRRCVGGSCVMETDAGATSALGAACTRSAECVSGICLPPALGGVCTQECTEAVECFDVGEAGCSPVVEDEAVRALCTLLPPDARRMGSPCTSDDQCEGRVCQEGQCTEVCNDDSNCLAGQTCMTLPRAGTSAGTFLGCGYRPRTTPVQLDTVPLGELDLAAGRIGTVELAAPSDTVSITFQARRIAGDPLELTFVTISDPSETPVFDIDGILTLVDQPLRWIPIDTGEMITALLPNSTPDRLALVPGLHRWSVAALPRTASDTGSARVRLTAVIKRAATRPPSAGTIDLDVHLAGVGLDATTAASDARLQGALARLETILAAVGVGIGDVRYHVISDRRYAIIDSTAGEDSELAGLFRQSAPRSGRRLNLFLVRSISGGTDGFRALGIAGGIPGPVGEHGTQHSGVVVAFDPAIVGTGSSGANRVGHVMAHEIGHYLGLYHVTEQSRPCGPGETEGCAPFGGGDTLTDTRHGDTGNLMHWSIVSSGSNIGLSMGQGFVMRVSALAGP